MVFGVRLSVSVLIVAVFLNRVKGTRTDVRNGIYKVNFRVLKRKYVYAKQLIVRGHKLMGIGDTKRGKRFLKIGTKAVKQLKELENAYRMVDYGNQLIKAGKVKRGTKRKNEGCEIIKNLGSGLFIHLPDYKRILSGKEKTLRDVGRQKVEQEKRKMYRIRFDKEFDRTGGKMMMKLDAKLISDWLNKYLYAKKLIKKAISLVKRGEGIKGRELLKQGKNAIKKLKQLGIAYKKITRGHQLVNAGKKREGKQLMRSGFIIKMMLGSGANIRLPGFQTMNATRGPSPKVMEGKVRKMSVYARRMIIKGHYIAKRGRVSEGGKLVRQGTKALNHLKKLERGYKLIDRVKQLVKSGKTHKGRLVILRGFKIKNSLGAGKYVRLLGFLTMDSSRRPSKKVMNKISSLLEKYLYAKMLIIKGNLLSTHGKGSEGRKLEREGEKAINHLTKLGKGYKMIADGRKLLKAGKLHKGKLLIYRGFKIKMSLGSGSYIRLPGFQTMNSSRRPPPHGSVPLDSHPRTCACKLATGLAKGICYETTGNSNNTIRACRKRTCKASYVCVLGVQTSLTCIRKKKRSYRAVPLRPGVCRVEDFEWYVNVPYAN